MTIQTTINGVTTQQTASPVGSLLGVLYADLPNCATNSVSFAACARANTENDWVIYDFPGASPGATVSITVISGNNQFTEDCDGSMYPAVTGNFTIPNIVEPEKLPDVSMCGGVASDPIVFPFIADVIFNWSNDNPAIGLGVSGVGDIASFIPTIGATPQIANIEIADGCFLDTFQITILPAPDPLVAINSASPSGTSCVYDSFNINGNTSTMFAPETITDWAWDFGDGTTSTSMNNVHKYGAAGTYPVGLTLTGSNGCINTGINNYIVYPKPAALFSTNIACLGDATNFAGAASNVAAPNVIANHIWAFGDGGISVSTDPSHSYVTEATYNAELVVVTDQGCRDTVVNDVFVFPDPSPLAVIDNYCFYDSLSFSSASSTINAPGVITQYLWDFGDGQTSTSSTPKHLYAAQGDYNVSLTVTSGDGCSNQFNTTATAHPAPVALFNVTDKCLYDAVPFDASASTISSGTIVTYAWRFDDDKIGSSAQTTNQYTTDGPYTAELIVTSNNNCKDSLTKPLTVFPVPAAAFTFENKCLGEAISFSSASSSIGNPGNLNNYEWIFADGGVSTNQNPSHMYVLPQTYTVQLKTTSGDGCVDSTSSPVTTHPKPVATFTFDDRCTYDVFNFDASTSTVGNSGAITGYGWTYGDGNTGNGITNSNLYAADGTYTVQLIIATDNNCLDTAEMTSTAYPVPVADFTFTNQCLNIPISFDASGSTINNPGSITNYTWDFAGTASSLGVPTNEFTFATPDIFEVTLTVTSDQNCVHTTSLFPEVFPLPEPMFTFLNACEQSPVFYSNTSSISKGNLVAYTWDLDNGTASSVTNPLTSYDIAGIYNVKLKAVSGSNCEDSITIPIDVKSKPTARFGAGPLEGCSPLCVDYIDSSSSNSTSMTNYFWKFSSGETSTNQNQNTCFDNDDNEEDDIFTINPMLVVTNDLGCKDSTSNPYNVKVYHYPVSSFGATPSETDMHHDLIQLNNYSLGTDRYQWVFSDGDSSNTFEPEHHYTDTGTFVVKLFNYTINGCIDSSENPVYIAPVIHFNIPNAFTPDGDGKNDEFNWQGYGIEAENFEFYIYNRWGELLFHTNEFKGWNGYVNGRLAQQDVYVFKVNYTDVFDLSHSVLGTVTLVR